VRTFERRRTEWSRPCGGSVTLCHLPGDAVRRDYCRLLASPNVVERFGFSDTSTAFLRKFGNSPWTPQW
jgi:hypothetical protein